MTPGKRGRLETPAKSPYDFESYDSDWERQYMEELEADADVDAWTKQHKVRIPYIDGQSRKREYLPDFLVRLDSGHVELHEVKGTQLMESGDTKRKFEAGRAWCAEREMKFVVVTKGP